MTLLLLLFSLAAHADTKISDLPLGNAATTNVNDSFPYVDSTGPITKRLKLSDLPNLPAFASLTASGLSVSSISSSAALTAGSPINYKHVACDATAGSVVATLPACLSGIVGQVFNLKKIDSTSNYCTFARTGSDLIDGQTSLATNQQYLGLTVVCRAAGYWDVL